LAELQYCRARIALKNLRGSGVWEETLKELQRSDVRALNERELSTQEKEDIHRARVRGGGDVTTIDDE
jgi:hypothetical protein